MRVALALLALILFAAAAAAEPLRSRTFVTSDGVRLHYLEGGPSTGHTIVFVPGWTMPAWIWGPQLQGLGRRYHVVAFDPRGQGDSDIPATGYDYNRRGQDIAELLARIEPVPAVIVAWSLGVLDTLAYVHHDGDALIAGLVLVDNSVGEDPAPVPVHRRPGPVLSHNAKMRLFVQNMFRQQQSETYLERLTEATLRTPEFASRALLSYAAPRTYWRDALYSTSKPVLYAIRPVWLAQAENLERRRPNTEIALFTHAGHALFVDDAARFNALLEGFIRRRIWP